MWGSESTFRSVVDYSFGSAVVDDTFGSAVVDNTFGSAMVDDDERAVSSVLITFGIVDLAGCMGAGMKINDWALEEEQGEDDDIY